MTVVTGSGHKNMPVCFLRHTLSNEMLEFPFKVHIKVILNIQTEHEKTFDSLKVVSSSSM